MYTADELEIRCALAGSPRAEQLIACLEGEIAKRDAQIVELESAAESLRLSRDYHHEQEIEYRRRWAGLYAAPVSEAKAQGVVQWPDADEIMQMAFEEGQPADDASGYYFELEEFDLFIERLISEVARLNSAPVQQVSVPASAFASRAITHYEAALLAAFPSGSSGEVFNQWNEARRVLAAAPAAPAADAGLVEALELAADRLDRLALEQGKFWRGYATEWADEARATANGVKS